MCSTFKRNIYVNPVESYRMNTVMMSRADQRRAGQHIKLHEVRTIILQYDNSWLTIWVDANYSLQLH